MELTAIISILAIVAGLFAIIANHRLNVWREKRNERVKAAAVFRADLNTDFITDNLTGYFLVNALMGVTTGTLDGSRKIEGLYYKHKRAVHEFRHYLGPIDRIRLDRAWKAYHGRNEEYPDFFVRFGIPVNGPCLLKEILEKLRSIGS